MKKVKINISEEPHCKELESFGSIFMPIIKGNMTAEDLVQTDILFNWETLVGKDLAAFCNPVKTKIDVKNNSRTLVVEVPVGGFALELQHKEHYILEKINAYFGYPAVNKISVMQNAGIRLKGGEGQNTKEKELSPEDKKYLLEVTDGIKDEKLKEILMKLGNSIITSLKGEK